MMVAEEGQRPVLKGWGDPDLTSTIDERFRMVVLDWESAPRLAAHLAHAIRVRQRETPIAVLVPCWSDLEVGARRAADFFLTKPLRVTRSAESWRWPPVRGRGPPGAPPIPMERSRALRIRRQFISART